MDVSLLALPPIFFFVLGTVIGSFLNVVIYRLHTGKSLSGRSHCLSCGVHLSWYELVPILSYVAQRGKCRSCRARIAPRYLYGELFTGLLFFSVANIFLSDAVALVLTLGIVALLVVILVYDLRHTIIPDELVLYLGVLAIVYILWSLHIGAIARPFFDMLFGAIVPAVFFGALWYISAGRWIGLGDAKLAIPLGLMLGMNDSLSMLMLAFWIGAIVGVGGLVLKQIPYSSAHALYGGQPSLLFLSRRLTMKSEVPFAPFLICAFLLVHLGHLDAFAIVNAAIVFFFV